MQQMRHIYIVHGDLIRWDLYDVHDDLYAAMETSKRSHKDLSNAVMNQHSHED